MKLIHWLFLLLVLIGGLFLFHNWQSHGGMSGVKQGMGFGGHNGGYGGNS